jgi:hypothetical protein
MNDFTRIVLALGRGVIKILISGLLGVGVGMLVFGITTAGKPEIWEMRRAPGEMFIAIGAGLLSGSGMLLVLFLIPWLMKRTTEPPLVDDPPVLARPAPRPPRHEGADESSFPRSIPTPPRDEAGPGGFYEK